MSNRTPLEPLFKELDNFIKDSDFDQAVSICNKILAVDPNDADAFACKCIALIQTSKFDEAIKHIESNPKLSTSHIFEHAYCLYRNKQLKEALNLLKTHPEPKPPRVSELEAQVHYRLEDFDSCIKIYEQLLNEGKVTTTELKTNLAAAYVSAGNTKAGEKLVDSNKGSLKEHYEFAYNSACIALEAGNYSEAESFLKVATDVCRSSMTEDGASEQEIQDELGIIQTQLGLVYQLQGKAEDALSFYNNILKNKLSDESISAVASNNIVVLKKEHDLFDSFKKMKQATSQALEQKLTSTQKKIIGFNNCLLLLYMNKGDQCRELVKLQQEHFPDSDRLALILAALLHREKKVAKSEELLKSFAEQYPDKSLRVQLALAQLHLSKGNVQDAINILEAISTLKNKPVMVATLVSLYGQIDNIDGAIRVFDEYTASYEKKDDEEFVKLLKENANFKLKHKRYKEAAVAFERVLKVQGNDLEALGGLVISASQFDPVQAEKYGSKIPRISTGAEVNAETLENLAAPRIGAKKDVEEKGDTSAAIEQKKKIKKKKKPRKSKNYDPAKPLDPERWLPMKERSYYKKRTRKGKAEKGAQGIQEKKVPPATTSATSTTTTTTTTKPATPQPASKPPAQSTTTPQSPPTTQKSQTQSQSKKKSR